MSYAIVLWTNTEELRIRAASEAVVLSWVAAVLRVEVSAAPAMAGLQFLAVLGATDSQQRPQPWLPSYLPAARRAWLSTGSEIPVLSAAHTLPGHSGKPAVVFVSMQTFSCPA